VGWTSSRGRALLDADAPQRPHDDRARELTARASDVELVRRGKDTLARRVRRSRPHHWAEEAPSRTCHMVSNVQIVRRRRPGGPTEVLARCRFLVYRNRVETETDVLVGKREDVLAGWTDAGRSPVAWSSRQSVLLPRT